MWCSRMQGEDSQAHELAFQRWLAQSSLHRRIYSEISELFRFGEELENTAPLMPEGQNSDEDRPVRRKREGGRIYAAVAAFALLSSGLLAMWMYAGHPNNGIITQAERPQFKAFQTAIGEIRALHLDDGSIVTLDTASEIAVAMTGNLRTIRLVKGRARFEVAHERRAFVVSAGNTAVKALGTIFDVSITPEQIVRVALLRGAVAVRSSGTSKSNKKAFSRTLSAGETVLYRPQIEGLHMLPEKASMSESWTTGLATYEGAPLGTVIAEANRYASQKLRLADPALAERPVYGTLKIDEPHALATVLARSLDLRLSASSNDLFLSSQ